MSPRDPGNGEEPTPSEVPDTPAGSDPEIPSPGEGGVARARPVDEEDVTSLLSACAAGDRAAFDRLMPLIYDDLRGIASRRLRAERSEHTLDTTAVVHEAYLRLAERATATWRDRVHFFAVAARVIRHVLIDYARRRSAAKRGGDAVRVELSHEVAGEDAPILEVLALDDALSRLESLDSRLAKVVECRVFAGMAMDEVAEALGVSLRTAERDWRRAKAHLYRMLFG